MENTGEHKGDMTGSEFLASLDIDKTIASVRQNSTIKLRDVFRAFFPPLNSVDTPKTAPEIGPETGDEMDDGTIFAGYFKGRPLYATPRDAPGTYTFNEAASYAKNLDAHGRHDFHVPSQGELNVLWKNRNKGKLKETFNETGHDNHAGWYWSSSRYSFISDDYAWGQCFSDGYQNYYGRNLDSSLRCVR
jgi:hypothetical protein